MQVIWRLYNDARRQWHWKKIGPAYAVVGKSSKSYKNYEACMENAQEGGYVFQASPQ